MTIFLNGNNHTAEHFKIEGEVPNRVLIQTDEDYYSIFQHNGKVVNGSYEFRFVRTERGELNTTGYFATETETSPDWGSMYK